MGSVGLLSVASAAASRMIRESSAFRALSAAFSGPSAGFCSMAERRVLSSRWAPLSVIWARRVCCACGEIAGAVFVVGRFGAARFLSASAFRWASVFSYSTRTAVTNRFKASGPIRASRPRSGARSCSSRTEKFIRVRAALRINFRTSIFAAFISSRSSFAIWFGP